MRKRNKLVYGVGVNDANYHTQTYAVVNGKQVRTYCCPFYKKWKSMLQRCYSESYYKKYKSYEDCYVCEGWHKFSNFKSWMEKQDWVDRQLDKDLLFRNNKIYSPKTCVFVLPITNSFLKEKPRSRGKYLIGVYFAERIGKFCAECSDPFLGKSKHLGYYTKEVSAHLAWKEYKNKLANKIAEMETDSRVVEALKSRYSGNSVYD